MIGLGDLWHDLRRNKLYLTSMVFCLLICLAALFAPLVASQDPYDLGKLNLMDSFLPPIGGENSEWKYLLGTDDQGRDLFSAILYGARLSLFVGLASVVFAMVLGVSLGLISGYAGGAFDAVIMRVADVQLSFPALLIALLIDGVARGVTGGQHDENDAVIVLIIAIGLSFWVQYARTVRGSVIVEKRREYVQAARLIGVSTPMILLRHILPNIMGPVFVIATINLAIAIIAEATLSYLGVGMPPTRPSLGTLVRVGSEFLFSGEWWIALFPGFALAAIVVSFNLVGDWLRDALNPKLR